MLHYKVILHVLVFMLLTTISIWILFNNITQVPYFALFAPPFEFFVSLAECVCVCVCVCVCTYIIHTSLRYI